MLNAKYFLKRMAALQFESSVENQGAVLPIHILEEESDEQHEVGISQAEGAILAGDRYSIISEITGNSYASLEEFIAAESDRVEILDCESYENYNKRIANSILAMPIIPLDKALAKGSIPNSDGMNDICSLADYLEAYGFSYAVQEADLHFFVYSDEWRTKAVAFTRKGAEETKDSISNHIFGKTRYRAWNDGNTEFAAIMKFLLESGEKLLAEDNKDLQILWKYRMNPDEFDTICHSVGNDANISVGEYTVQDASGNELMHVQLLACNPETSQDYVYWTNKIQVHLSNGETFDLPYPIAHDKYMEKGMTDEGAVKIYNYALYKQ